MPPPAVIRPSNFPAAVSITDDDVIPIDGVAGVRRMTIAQATERFGGGGGGGSGTVTSVGLSVPAFLSVAGSPITGPGTLAVSLAVQNANKVFAGPATGSDAAPTFRALVAADLPSALANGTTISGSPPAASDNTTKIATTAFVQAAIAAAGGGGGSGTVTSVAMSVPGFLSVAGSPVTTSGTLAVTLAVQNANKVFAGPATGGDAAPTFRVLVAADLPSALANGTTISGSPPSNTDNSTKIATTAWVNSYTIPFTSDGSGHYYIGGSGPITLESGSLALLSVIGGGLAVYNPTGSTLIRGRKDTGVDVIGTVLTIQRTGTGTGGSADIGFATGDNPGSGLTANANYGCIFLANEGGGYPSDDGIGVSGQPGWLLSNPTAIPTSGIGRVGMYQEWADNGEINAAGIYDGSTHVYYVRPVFAARHDFSVFVADPYYTAAAVGGDTHGRTLELPATPNSGYAQWIIKGTPSYRLNGGTTYASAGLVIKNDDHDGDTFTINVTSSNAGVGGMYTQSCANIISECANGMTFYTNHSGASIRFGSGSGTLAMTLDGSQNLLIGTTSQVGAALLTVAGQVYGTSLRTAQTTVAGLPNAATAGAGARAFVTDSNATMTAGIGATVAGSGSNKVPVYSDGTNWIIG
jgi:hypothetical protein